MGPILLILLLFLGFWALLAFLVNLVFVNVSEKLARHKKLSFLLAFVSVTAIGLLISYAYDKGESLFIWIFMIIYVMLDGKGPG